MHENTHTVLAVKPDKSSVQPQEPYDGRGELEHTHTNGARGRRMEVTQNAFIAETQYTPVILLLGKLLPKEIILSKRHFIPIFMEILN